MIVVKVRDRDIKAAPMGPVTTGSVGLPVSWHFIGKEWEDLAKAAVFRVGEDGEEITVAVLEDMCLVPDELLVQANAGENLWIGVYGWKGTNANDTIIPEIAMPTIWTYTRIQDGSQPSGIEPPEGTPGWSAQIQNATDEALRVAHGAAADAAEGDFDGISPAVTISSITHGHSVTITDRDHPTGQSFPVLDGDSAYEQAVAGGYTGTEAQFNEELASFKTLSEQAADSAEQALSRMNSADASAQDAEAYAIGKRNGVDVGAGDPAHNNNSKYYMELAAHCMSEAGSSETAAASSERNASNYASSAQNYAGQATSSASDAATAKGAAETAQEAAEEAAEDAEAYAVGKRGGTDVGSTDPAYHNNAKYYAEQASGSATAASGSATSAASSATAAGNAQTAAETAQGAAEDAQAAAEAVLASIPSDYTELSEDVADLKSAFEKSETVKDFWIVAGVAAGGNYASVNIRLASRRFDSNEFIKCRTLTGYAFVVSAWDANNVFLGKFDGNGFSTSSSGVNLTEFDFTEYPGYSFVVSLLNSVNPSTVMSIEDGVNCIFDRNYLGNMPNVVDAVSNYGIFLSKASNIPGGVVSHVSCNLEAGDTIFIQMVGTPSSTFNCSAYNNGVLVKKFINSVNITSAQVGCSRKITFAAECNEIRLHSTKAYSYTIYKVVYGHVNMTIAEQVANNTRLAYDNESVTNISTDSNGAQILGESAIDINRQFFQAPKMKMVLLDNNYKYFSVANIELIIDSMEQSGLNYLVLGFGGSGRGLCFELDDMHITSYGITYDLSNCLLTGSGKYLTESDMETIISYARSKNVDIVPSFNMPGHFGPFLNYQPKFKYGNDANSVDINNPQARDYAYKCAELYLNWFAKHDCKYWLFGADEFGDILDGYYNLRNAGNYNYALFINQIAYIAAKHRMIPLAWNDAFCIDGNPYPFINRKVPVLYWRKGTEHWGTPAEISANGNALINSSSSIYWVANGPQVTEEQIRAFNVHEFKDGTTVADPIGACFCIWIGSRESPALDDDGDAITTAVRPLIVAFGETIASQFN